MKESEEKTLTMDATVSIDFNVHGIEYLYEKGDRPDRELLEEHVAELFRCEAFGDILDLVNVDITYIDTEEGEDEIR